MNDAPQPSSLQSIIQQSRLNRYGWLPEFTDHRDRMLDIRKAARWRGRSLVAKLPAAVDLRSTGLLPSIKDQGPLGSCTANGWAAAVEYELNRQKASIGPVSRLMIYYNERALEGSISYDSGAFIRDGIKSIAKLGVAPETEWPYDISRFTDSPPQQVYNDALQHQALVYGSVICNGVEWHIKQALAVGTPVVYGFSVYPEYENIGSDGLMKLPAANSQLLGGHCNVFVGYTKIGRRLYFISMNSWGTSWGDQGFCYMPASWVTAKGMWNADDMWAIQSME